MLIRSTLVSMSPGRESIRSVPSMRLTASPVLRLEQLPDPGERRVGAAAAARQKLCRGRAGKISLSASSRSSKGPCAARMNFLARRRVSPMRVSRESGSAAITGSMIDSRSRAGTMRYRARQYSPR